MLRVFSLFAFSIAAVASAAPVNASILGDTPVLPDVLTTLLAAYKPLLANYTKTQLPATIGSCAADQNPPAPCSEVGYLYEDKSTFYHVLARWVSGINTMRLDDLTMKFDDAGSLTLNLNVNFAQLPASLQVQGCAGVLGCTTVIDNTNSCCGTDKSVAMTATATCSESYPFLANFVVTRAAITPPINVQINILGKTWNVKDVTPSIENGLKTTAGKFLATTGLDLFNGQIKSLFGDKIFCSQKSKDAQTPAPTNATAAPSPAPTNATSGSSGSTPITGPTTAPTDTSGLSPLDKPATSVPAKSSSPTPVTSEATTVHFFSGLAVTVAALVML
ncbi:Aste57867_14701 [Aphanomyces stellatus]|uniref:Aste57867_14701 protein n=1 Tax=Aphanomyces stellatus TaxID=120398 RepID=A0A485L1D0_9STRA|nr:hypothetical protein As57867_014646 [Aphanomyces stellatus]VFT91519.1 Aste57867_14701 [Aphanomyces stellatus]